MQEKPILRVEQGVKKGLYAQTDDIVAGFGFNLRR